MNDYKIRQARGTDLASISALLEDCGLPFQDIAAHLGRFRLAEAENGPAGVIGAELFGEVCLLRSFAVGESFRSLGLGKALLRDLLAYVAGKGVGLVFLLTTTAEQYFSKYGFIKADKTTAPAQIAGTEEFKNICPDSAVLMVREL